MNLQHVQYFVKVCDLGSVTKAADQLHISQPGLTAAIRELEKEFSLKLFSKSGRTLKLTEAGEVFYVKAKELLDKASKTIQVMEDYSEGRNHLRLGITPMLALLILPRLYPEFKKKCPQTSLTIEEQGRPSLMDMLDRRDLDLVVTSYHKKLDEEHEFSKIMELDFGLCTYPAHPCANRSEVSVTEIGDSPLAAFSLSYQQNEVIQDYFAEEDMSPNIVFRSGQLSTLLELTSCQEFSCFMYTAIQKYRPDLKFIPLVPRRKIPIYLCWRKDDNFYPNMQILKTILDQMEA